MRNQVYGASKRQLERTKSGPKGPDSGFTLIELLVVLSILVLLATVATPQVLKYLGGAKTSSTKTQIANLVSAVEMYYLDVGQYPPPDAGLKALVQAPNQATRWLGPYLKKTDVPLDPWGKPYVYRAPGQNGAFDIFSLGRDGQPGGTGEDADITSW